ncbi:hypothetical protein F4779DRAFT_641977 [Xylariaceae sp. FL0662B]|nr:hypothetical protein F4779DRAFT_641977 [Xylariaceae sp. FL0662B]
MDRLNSCHDGSVRGHADQGTIDMPQKSSLKPLVAGTSPSDFTAGSYTADQKSEQVADSRTQEIKPVKRKFPVVTIGMPDAKRRAKANANEQVSHGLNEIHSGSAIPSENGESSSAYSPVGSSVDEMEFTTPKKTKAADETDKTVKIHAHKPLAHGRPPVWAIKRAAMNNALPYFAAHQGSLYSQQNVAYSMFMDKIVGVRDKFLSQVVITTIGGGRELDPVTKEMVRMRDQEENSRSHKCLNNTYKQKRPIALIAGAGNSLFPVKPAANYNVLDYFHITDIWTEASKGSNGQLIKHFMIRFERIDLNSRSWWTPKNANGGADAGEYFPGDYYCTSRRCATCNTSSKEMYKQGWTCLNRDCNSFFEFEPSVNLDDLEYNDNFLNERTEHTGPQPEHPLVTPLPSEASVGEGEVTGTEKAFKRGIVCPECRCCSRRIRWESWYCENPACDFTHHVPIREMPMKKVKEETAELLRKKKGKFFQTHESIATYEANVGGYEVKTFMLRGEPHNADQIREQSSKSNGGKSARGSSKVLAPEGDFIGSVTVLHPTTADAYERAGGLNELYRDLQKEDINLQRRPAMRGGSNNEELTNHFSTNFGAPYKFGVAVQTLAGFDEAPEPVMKSLLRLSWAGDAAIQTTAAHVNEHGLPVQEGAIPTEFQPFNEELILAYFQDCKIRYHDDGEKELGPTVATLSLGSPAVMQFRAKRNKVIGYTDDLTKKERGSLLSFVLENGDKVVMHGAMLQQNYDHQVVPVGKNRIALTCRHIREETIGDEKVRQEAIMKGKIPEYWAAQAYDGETDVQVGPAVSIEDTADADDEGHDQHVSSNDILDSDNESSDMTDATGTPSSDQDRLVALATELKDKVKSDPELLKALSDDQKDLVIGPGTQLTQKIYQAR